MPGFWTTTSQRLRRLVQDNRKTLLSFAIPAFILFIGYMTRGVFPVANRNVLTIDLYHQYAPFMMELQEKFKTGGSLFYSWTGGLGNNFYALFAYYLASPLNIITVFFTPSYLTEAIMLLIVLKIGLSGACFYLFLRGVWRQENYFMVAVSILYALSSYSLAYSWNIMWLDGIFLMPLIMLGLVQMMRDRKFMLYTIAVGLLIFSNYYIAFFVCIFTALYFIVCLFEYQSLARPGAFFAAVGRFFAFSAIGAGLAAILAVPTYFSLKLTSAAGDAMPRTVTHYYELFDYIGQHFMLTPPTIRDGMPNMYAGVVLLILVPIYFLAKSVPLRHKFLHLGLILVLIVSFNVNVLNFLWHGMHFPNQLPYRNSFVYIFLILSMAYPALMALKEFSGKQIGSIAAAAVGIVLLAQKLNDKTPELQTLYVTIVFLAIYAAVLTLDRIRPLRRSDLALAVLFVVIAELSINTLLTLHRIDTTEYYSNREGYMAGRQVDEIRSQLKALDRLESGFYRVEIQPPRTTNDPFMYQYYGVSIFASTMQTKPVKMFENLGYHSNSINSYKNEGSTLVLDSLFGVKYQLRRSGNQTYELWQSIVKTDQIEVFRNPYALSLGYVGLPELAQWRSSGSDPFSAQNKLVKALAGTEDNVLLPLELESGELDNMTFSGSSSHVYSYRKTNKDQDAVARVKVLNDQDQHVYLYFEVTANKPDRGYVMIGERKIDFNAKRSTMVDLGHVLAGEEIIFNMTFDAASQESGRFELYASALDPDAFARAIDTIRANSLVVSSFSDTRVTGTVQTDRDGILLLTMPYDEGWKVLLDGEPVAIEAIDNGLISVPVTAGTHKVELRYTPLWFTVGLLISIISLLLLVFIGLLTRRSRLVAAERSLPRPVRIPAPDRSDEAMDGSPADPEIGNDETTGQAGPAVDTATGPEEEQAGPAVETAAGPEGEQAGPES